jgi:hypothetical protein
MPSETQSSARFQTLLRPRWRGRDALRAPLAAATRSGDTRAMLRLMLASVVALCALRASGARAADSASDGGLPECVGLHCEVGGCAPECASRLCRCALLVFRHVQKTGGSTLRNFFRKQEATGDWEFYRCARRSSSSATDARDPVLMHRVAQPAGRPQLAGGDQPKASRAAAILLGGACGRRGAARVRAELALRAQALESPASNFTRSPRRLIVEWHAEAHLLPPWEHTVEERANPPFAGEPCL